jgi:hypothetical protein
MDAVVLDVYCSVWGRRVGYREMYPPGMGRPADRGKEDPLRQLDRFWHYIDDGDRRPKGVRG